MKLDVPSVLSIAGSDPSGGAGIQADLRVYSALNVYGMAIPAILTVQNTLGVQAIQRVEPTFLESQINVLLDDITPTAIKIGALGGSEQVKAVVRSLSHYSGPIVLDPITISSSGTPLLDTAGLQALAVELVPKTTLITPNLDEWIVLKPLLQNHPPYVMVTGGASNGEIRDNLHTPEGTLCWSHPAIDTSNTHGTGCSLSSAIAVQLALGHPVPKACEMAIAFVTLALERSKGLQLGHGNGGLLYEPVR
ncbi:MAG: bifunctional hydroxymethylpyrimidine kinase/phosphomethylpyrimidine kinase [Myxococcota bacterium]